MTNFGDTVSGTKEHRSRYNEKKGHNNNNNSSSSSENTGQHENAGRAYNISSLQNYRFLHGHFESFWKLLNSMYCFLLRFVVAFTRNSNIVGIAG